MQNLGPLIRYMTVCWFTARAIADQRRASAGGFLVTAGGGRRCARAYARHRPAHPAGAADLRPAATGFPRAAVDASGCGRKRPGTVKAKLFHSRSGPRQSQSRAVKDPCIPLFTSSIASSRNSVMELGAEWRIDLGRLWPIDSAVQCVSMPY